MSKKEKLKIGMLVKASFHDAIDRAGIIKALTETVADIRVKDGRILSTPICMVERIDF